MDLEAGGYTLKQLSKVNVVLGKNGCGKSTLLKSIEQNLTTGNLGQKMYITPERGGTLVYEPNVDRNMSTNETWLSHSRRVNQFGQFREQSMVQFHKFELSAYRLAEEQREVADFQKYLDQLNDLLDRIEVYRAEATLLMRSKPEGEARGAEALSSGEAELISLGIELLSFAVAVEPDKLNVLLFDSPDVHLHPDLQGRLVRFLTKLVDEYNFHVVLATHSTAVLGGLDGYGGARVTFMRADQRELEFSEVEEVHRDVLPVFGAHPLSNVFNEVPVLILEGEDDVRIWQQAIRSSSGALRLYPVACGSVDLMSDYEQKVQEIVSSVYDEPKAYSLRDRDGHPEEINDMQDIIRMRLSCRSSENLILADEVLLSAGVDWDSVQARITDWVGANQMHERYDDMRKFQQEDFPRKAADLKRVRMLLTGVILASDKPWEVLVGQAIAQLPPATGPTPVEGSLADFLGSKVMRELLSPGELSPAAAPGGPAV
jgi:predicted ATPase